MKALYFDAFSGVSGDMTVGAFLALGLPLAHLREELERLPLRGYAIAASPRTVHGIVATKFHVEVEGAPAPAPHPTTPHPHPHPHPHAHTSAAQSHDEPASATHGSGHTHRRYRDIRAMLDSAALAAPVRDTAQAIFAVLADAEGKVHGVDPAEVSFHEVGAVDSIVDIVGAALGVHFFGVQRVYVSPLPLGSGVIRSQHGPIPVPGPATAELLRGFVTKLGDGEGEMVTPTGAAIIAALATPEAVPPLSIVATGYGAGTRELRDRPNVLRLLLADLSESREEEMVVLETNIDDLNPELYDHVMERLFAAGARDVFLTPVHMKKNRPGVVLSVVADPQAREQLGAIVLRETSAIGLRYYGVGRTVLERHAIEVETRFGRVRVKIASGPKGATNVAPEYEDCRRLALEHGQPLKRVYQEAVAAALRIT